MTPAPFRSAAVLGAGVMGAQIAAHLANAGLTVHLLDIAAEGNDRSAPARQALDVALRLADLFETDNGDLTGGGRWDVLLTRVDDSDVEPCRASHDG